MPKADKPTQNERVLAYMQRFGSISQKDAFVDLGIYRLASRISDLKKAGYPIKKTMVDGHNRFGETTHYAEYRLMEVDEPWQA